jgi:hypothetical protein
MPWCDIFIFCDCSDLHPMGIFLELKDGPAHTKNIADAYQGKETPPDLMRVVDNPVRCPKTNKLFQPNMKQIFLIPAAPAIPFRRLAVRHSPC